LGRDSKRGKRKNDCTRARESFQGQIRHARKDPCLHLQRPKGRTDEGASRGNGLDIRGRNDGKIPAPEKT